MAVETTPQVYVIIPNYNTSDLLCRCLASLRAQRGAPPMQIFVVDNASTDDSVACVRKEFPEVHLLESEHNGGFAYAVNLGLRAAQNGAQWQPDDYVLVLNSDTELPPDALERMLAFMEVHPEAGVAGPKLVLPDGRLDRAARRAFPSPEVAFYRLFGLSALFPRSRRFGRYNLTYLDPDITTEVDSVCGAFMLVRARVVDEVGPLDEAFFMYGEDLDWAYRIKQRGWKIYYYPEVVVRHCKRASSRQIPEATLRAFYDAMRIFHRKHYAARYPRVVNLLIEAGISLRYGLARLLRALGRRGGW